MMRSALNRVRGGLHPRSQAKSLFLTALVVGMSAYPVVGHAGVGSGDSGPTTVDTRAPVLALDPVPDNLLILGGQTVTFHWQVSDDHPGAAVDHAATVLIDAVADTSYDYDPLIADHTWIWTASEASSANVRVSVRAADAFGNTTVVDGNLFTVLPSTSDVPSAAAPSVPHLLPNVPNPSNPGTRLIFELPRAARVALSLYTPDGRLVRRFASQRRGPGRHEVYWNGRDGSGRPVASGTYLLRMETDTFAATRRLALIK